MEKNQNLVVSGLLLLIIGFGAGRYMQYNQENKEGVYKVPNSHMMANGQMMSDTPTDMASTMTSMMSGLNGKQGDAFDEAFLTEMITHHQGAVDMAKAALQDAKHPELKQLAQGIITAQTTEIAQMKGWQKSWYNQ